MEGREAKRVVFARANALLRHVILCKVRNEGLGAALTPLQAQDVNKVQPVDLLALHTTYAQLECSAEDAQILVLFLRIASPEPGRAYQPVADLADFVARTRAELGLPALGTAVREDRSFPVALDCNVIVPKLGGVK